MGKVIIIILAFLSVAGCYIDVMHSSGNDPGNTFGTGTVSFNIMQKDGSPIDSVNVYLNDTVYYAQNGSINDMVIINDTLHIILSRSGFDSICIDTVLKTGDKLIFDITMNSLPEIMSSAVYSCTEYVYSISDTIEQSVNIECVIKDRDLEDDIAACSVSIFDAILSLSFVSISGTDMLFSKTLNEDMRDFNIYDLQGEPMYISVIDMSGSADQSGPIQLVRFIEHIPGPVYPLNGETVVFPDTIKWDVPDIPYTVIPSLILWNAQGDTLIHIQLNEGVNSYYIDSLMPSGIYNMTVLLSDMYGNYSCRTIEFYIQ